jgi:signal transduction histidine kinase
MGRLQRDLTRPLAQVSAQLRLLQQAAQLQEAHDTAVAHAQAKSRFLANVSHEIRTPLHSVVGFAELVDINLQAALDAFSAAARKSTLTDELSAAREAIESSADQIGHVLSGANMLTSIVNDVLDVSKINEGKLEVRAWRCGRWCAGFPDRLAAQVNLRVCDLRDVLAETILVQQAVAEQKSPLAPARCPG